jgi:hypothetical protein
MNENQRPQTAFEVSERHHQETIGLLETAVVLLQRIAKMLEKAEVDSDGCKAPSDAQDIGRRGKRLQWYENNTANWTEVVALMVRIGATPRGLTTAELIKAAEQDSNGRAILARVAPPLDNHPPDRRPGQADAPDAIDAQRLGLGLLKWEGKLLGGWQLIVDRKDPRRPRWRAVMPN